MLLVPALAGCHSRGYTVVAGGQDTLQLTSSSFQDGSIPIKYTCDGAGDLSPELAWSATPATTKSFALIVVDPDAHPSAFVRWVLLTFPPRHENYPRDSRNRINFQTARGKAGTTFQKPAMAARVRRETLGIVTSLCCMHWTQNWICRREQIESRLKRPSEGTSSHTVN